MTKKFGLFVMGSSRFSKVNSDEVISSKEKRKKKKKKERHVKKFYETQKKSSCLFCVGRVAQ